MHDYRRHQKRMRRRRATLGRIDAMVIVRERRAKDVVLALGPLGRNGRIRFVAGYRSAVIAFSAQRPGRISMVTTSVAFV